MHGMHGIVCGFVFDFFKDFVVYTSGHCSPDWNSGRGNHNWSNHIASLVVVSLLDEERLKRI